MKLGQLKAAIRSTKGNPQVDVTFPGGKTIRFAMQKASVLEQLEAAFPGGKAVETDLIFDEKECLLRADGGAVAAPVVPQVSLMTDEPSVDLTVSLLPAETPAVAPSTGLGDLLI